MKKTGTSVIAPAVRPTLSPKDPAFPAWWEEHKGEWEDKAEISHPQTGSF